MFKVVPSKTPSDVFFIPISEACLMVLDAEERRWAAELARCAQTDDENSCLRQAADAQAARYEVNQARAGLVLAYCKQYRVDPNTQTLMALVEAHRAAVLDEAAQGAAAEPSAGLFGIVNDFVGAVK